MLIKHSKTLRPLGGLIAAGQVLVSVMTLGCAAAPGHHSSWQYDSAAAQWTISSKDFHAKVDVRSDGLIGGRIELVTGRRRLVIGGIQMRTLGSELTAPVSVRYQQKGRQLLIHHDFGDGLLTTTTLQLADDGPLLRCSVEPTDRIEMIRSGPLDKPLDCLAVDYGWLIKRPGKFTCPRLMTNFFLARTDDGSAVLVGCNEADKLLVDPDEHLYSLQAMYRTASATYWFGLADQWGELIDTYRQATNPQRSSRAERLVGRMLLDHWAGGNYGVLAPLVKTLRFVGAERLVIIRHNWQHHGYDVKLPDVYPPNPQFGTVAELAAFAKLCKTNDIPFGLHDNLCDLYLDAPSFEQCEQAFQPSEWNGGRQKPWLGWHNRHTGQTAVRHTPQSALKMMRRNLTLVRDGVGPSTTFLDVTSYCNPIPLETAAGRFIGPDQVLAVERQMYREAADIIAGPAIGEGCNEKFLGVVDTANSDLWNVKRWNNDPHCQDWEYFPLLDWLAHDCVVLQGAGYPGRYNTNQAGRLQPKHYQQPFIDDYRSTSLLFGHTPLHFVISAPFAVSVEQMAREYYLGVPFHQHVGLERIGEVRHEPNDIHRLTVRYANDTTVYVNRSREPWDVAGWTLPRFGVAIRGRNFSQATATWQGHTIDVVNRPGLLFFDMRGQRREWLGITTAGMLAAHKKPNAVEIIPLGGIDSVQIDLQRLLLDDRQVARVVLVDPTGNQRQVEYDGQAPITLDAGALELPDAENIFAPRYRKIVLQLI